jgi:hypothetical protein
MSEEIDMEFLRILVGRSGLKFANIEKELGIGNGTIGKAFKENRPLSEKWYRPIIDYLEKKIQQKKRPELQTEDVLQEQGFAVINKQTGLTKEQEDEKMMWLERLQAKK